MGGGDREVASKEPLAATAALLPLRCFHVCFLRLRGTVTAHDCEHVPSCVAHLSSLSLFLHGPSCAWLVCCNKRAVFFWLVSGGGGSFERR